MPDSKILNPDQIAAFSHGDGPLLIIAGAGTGKTTVITERIKYLILQKNVLPSEILALTFTEKAAKEMEERVDIAMPYGYTQMWISTFHAFCDRVLRDDAIHIGLNPAYKLATEAEIVLFLRAHLFDFKLDYFRPLGNPFKFIQGLMQHFSRLKDEDISVEEYTEYANNLKKKHEGNNQKLEADEVEVKKTLELANAYKTYEDLKVKEGLMDFSDLISNVLKLFRTRKNVLAEYQNRFKYILVDEFQDTNFAQNQLAILLSGKKQNITVVGDDDQAIYRWRGAAISNMVQFRKNFPTTKIVTLKQNYRSTTEILNSSYTMIQHNNPDRLEVKEKINKKLTSERRIKGAPIELFYTQRVENEAEAVVKKIQHLVFEKQFTFKDNAILVRANDHAQPFVRALERYGIPYQFLGPGQLFHREEIKDLIAYLKVLYNFEDSQSLYRVLLMPILGIEVRDIAALLNVARRKNYSLFETIEKIVTNDTEINSTLFLKDSAIAKLKHVYDLVQNHLKRVPKETAGQILYYFLQDTGLLKQFLAAETEKDLKKYENISRFFDKLKTFEAEKTDASVFAVVDWIDLSMQMGESPLAADIDWSENNAVNILTIHSSKGLEFPNVFLVNLVTQRFPTRERREQIPIPADVIKEILPEGDYHLQEERRLFYVGMTRARDNLFFTAATYYGEGKRERKLSPFVFEALGEENVAKLLNKEKVKKTAIQQSLLEWAPLEIKTPTIIASNQPLAITYLSYSQIQCFDICPLHYKLRYILKIPTQQTASQSFGTCVHAALRDFYASWLNGNYVNVEDAGSLIDKVWINEGYKSKSHELEAKERAKHVVTSYLKTYFDKSCIEKKTVKLEIPFSFFIKTASRPQGIKVGGRIDRVDMLDSKAIEIIDYKTGNNLPSEKELLNNAQLSVYALAATHVNDKFFNRQPEDVLLSLFYLEQDSKLTTSRTNGQLEDAKEQIMDIARKIETSEFACSGSQLCTDCEYKMLCSVH
jgi:DNA helicase-2/ATP-dependent DNA helicase PcrA